MNKQANCSECISNTEYGYKIAKLVHDELVVENCVLKCSARIVSALNALE